MRTIKSASINNFLPYMCETTLEFMTERMIKVDLYDELCSGSSKQSTGLREGKNQEEDRNLLHKCKVDTDNSSSTSKPQSLEHSPHKDNSDIFKIQNLNQNTQSFSLVLWKFISERYIPYLELLNHCGITCNQYGPILRSCLQTCFLELLNMDSKALTTYCREHKLDKTDMFILQFGLKITIMLSHETNNGTSYWTKGYKKDLADLKFLYERIKMGLEMKDIENQVHKSATSIMSLYSIVFPGEHSILESEELTKDANLPALKCARSILKQ